jgi:hypothetical protein
VQDIYDTLRNAGKSMPTGTRYWFRAKRYGWGWGLPLTWEGWLVLAGFVVLVIASAVMFPPPRAFASYLTCVAVLGLVLFGICWLKGEPARWRWGDDEAG